MHEQHVSRNERECVCAFVALYRELRVHAQHMSRAESVVACLCAGLVFAGFRVIRYLHLWLYRELSVGLHALARTGSLACFCMCLSVSRAGHGSARLGCWA